jgi:hypothetical protein
MLTAAVAELDPEKKAKVLEAVRTFDAFDEGIDGVRFFWKFDYYAPDMRHGSDDPNNVEQTRRVLTIGVASDY